MAVQIRYIKHMLHGKSWLMLASITINNYSDKNSKCLRLHTFSGRGKSLLTGLYCFFKRSSLNSCFMERIANIWWVLVSSIYTHFYQEDLPSCCLELSQVNTPSLMLETVWRTVNSRLRSAHYDPSTLEAHTGGGVCDVWTQPGYRMRPCFKRKKAERLYSREVLNLPNATTL